ncbi:hypothetical protein LINPERHAP1_LOCUS30589 [Linum perenne]
MLPSPPSSESSPSSPVTDPKDRPPESRPGSSFSFPSLKFASDNQDSSHPTPIPNRSYAFALRGPEEGRSNDQQAWIPVGENDITSSISNGIKSLSLSREFKDKLCKPWSRSPNYSKSDRPAQAKEGSAELPVGAAVSSEAQVKGVEVSGPDCHVVGPTGPSHLPRPKPKKNNNKRGRARGKASNEAQPSSSKKAASISGQPSEARDAGGLNASVSSAPGNNSAAPNVETLESSMDSEKLFAGLAVSSPQLCPPQGKEMSSSRSRFKKPVLPKAKRASPKLRPAQVVARSSSSGVKKDAIKQRLFEDTGFKKGRRSLGSSSKSEGCDQVAVVVPSQAAIADLPRSPSSDVVPAGGGGGGGGEAVAEEMMVDAADQMAATTQDRNWDLNCPESA